MEGWDKVVPQFLREMLSSLDPKARDAVEELRLREGFPLAVVQAGEEWTHPAWRGRPLTEEALRRVLETAGRGSVHTVLDQLRSGYVTAAGGVRVGICGSGTYQAACLAKSMFEEEQGEGKMTIEVIDSKTYTYIYGHIVVKAAEMREQGESFDAIVSVVKSRLNRVEAYLGVYSLKFLKKSGRISGGAAFVGEALGLKPISHVYDGAVKVCDKVRGEKALVAGMSKKVSARVVQPDKQTAILLYGDVPAERLDEMEKRLRTEIGFRDVERVAIGPSVLTNTGPLAMAVAYYGTPRD